jgi:ligand-binding sensor domain-containing protein
MSAGFLWVGTRRGLQRFDGYAFVPIAALDSTAARDLGGPIADLHVDLRGRLWILASGRIYWGWPGQEPLRSIVAGGSWAAGSGGQLWYFRDTLHRIDWHAASPRVTAVPAGVPRGCCRAMAAGPDGMLWLARGGPGLATVTRLEPVTGARQDFPLRTMSQVAALVVDPEGGIWAGGFGGVEFLKPGAGQFRLLPAFGSANVGALALDGPGRLLLAANGWIARIDGQGQVLAGRDVSVRGKRQGPAAIVDRGRP